MTQINLRWYLWLIVLFFAGDRLGGLVMERICVSSQFRYARMYAGAAQAEILLLGNSRGLSFYQPAVEQLTGVPTFNFSYNGLPMDAAKCLLLDYLDRYPAPRALVVDITACDRENDPLLAGFLCYSAYSPHLDTLIHRKMPKVWWGGQVSALFRYNNEIFQRAWYYRKKSDADWLLDRVISPDLAAKASENVYKIDVSPYLIRQMKELTDAARSKGIRVSLVICPYLPGFKVENLDALKVATEQATGIKVLDYRSALSEPALFGDFMHVNKQGAELYMNLLNRDAVFN